MGKGGAATAARAVRPRAVRPSHVFINTKQEKVGVFRIPVMSEVPL